MLGTGTVSRSIVSDNVTALHLINIKRVAYDRGHGGTSTRATGIAHGRRRNDPALVQIDRLQPKFAAYVGATVRGSIPLAGDTVLIGELTPGNEVFRLVDAALKASRVETASQIVEREFGFFILRSH